MKIGDKYTHNGTGKIATIEEIVEAGGSKKNNGKAVIFRYAGMSYSLKVGMVRFLKSHKELL